MNKTQSVVTEVATPHAPKAVGPYSQAIIVGDYVYCSGQIALVPATGALVAGDVSAQTDQALANMGAVLTAAGCVPSDVVMSTIYLTSIDDFAAVNARYEAFFSARPFPARATVAVAALPKGALVEIACVAYKPHSTTV